MTPTLRQATVRGPQSREAPAPDYVNTIALDTLLTSRPAVTIVVAPAGYGKTALLDAFADRVQTQGVLVTRSPVGSVAPAAPAAPGRARIRLVDDGHLLHDDLLLSLVSNALAGAGDHVVIATRRLPSADLISLQLEGGVLLIDARDLVLSEAGAANLFERRSGKSLEAELQRELHDLTGGWALAVSLCGLVARRSPQRHVVSLANLLPRDQLRVYFETRVQADLAAETRGLLARLAVFDQISSELVSATLGEDGRCFRRLQAACFIISPSPKRDGWFEIHPLYRRFLLEEASQAARHDARAVLAAAADWSLQNGFIEDAIEYRMRAGLFEAAQELLERQAWTTVRRTGDFPRITSWILGLERAGARITPTLRLWEIWSLVMRTRLDDAIKALDRLQAASALSETDLAFAERLRLSIAARSEPSDRVCDQAEAWLHRWEDVAPHHTTGISFVLALARFDQCEEVAAKRRLHLMREIAWRLDSSYAKAWTLCAEAYVELICGRANAAALLVHDALATARAAGEAQSPLYGAISLVAAAVHHELGDVASTQEYLAFARRHRDTHIVIETRLAGEEAAAGVAEAIGGADAAVAELRRWSSGSERVEAASRVQLVQVLLRAGRIADARREFDAGFGQPAGIDGLALGVSEATRQDINHALAWLLCAEGDLPAAEALLQKLVSHAEAHGRGRRLVSLWLLRSTLHALRRDLTGAERALSRALNLASAGGLTRTVLNTSWALREQIGALPLNSTPDARFAAFLQDVRQRMGLAPLGLDRARQPLEPLTTREREILRMLESACTAQDLADAMSISLATAKWHIRNVYNKLGVRSRSGAVALAREVGLN